MACSNRQKMMNLVRLFLDLQIQYIPESNKRSPVEQLSIALSLSSASIHHYSSSFLAESERQNDKILKQQFAPVALLSCCRLCRCLPEPDYKLCLKEKRRVASKAERFMAYCRYWTFKTRSMSRNDVMTDLETLRQRWGTATLEVSQPTHNIILTEDTENAKTQLPAMKRGMLYVPDNVLEAVARRRVPLAENIYCRTSHRAWLDLDAQCDRWETLPLLLTVLSFQAQACIEAMHRISNQQYPPNCWLSTCVSLKISKTFTRWKIGMHLIFPSWIVQPQNLNMREITKIVKESIASAPLPSQPPLWIDESSWKDLETDWRAIRKEATAFPSLNASLDLMGAGLLATPGSVKMSRRVWVHEKEPFTLMCMTRGQYAFWCDTLGRAVGDHVYKGIFDLKEIRENWNRKRLKMTCSREMLSQSLDVLSQSENSLAGLDRSLGASRESGRSAGNPGISKRQKKSMDVEIAQFAVLKEKEKLLVGEMAEMLRTEIAGLLDIQNGGLGSTLKMDTTDGLVIRGQIYSTKCVCNPKIEHISGYGTNCASFSLVPLVGQLDLVCKASFKPEFRSIRSTRLIVKSLSANKF